MSMMHYDGNSTIRGAIARYQIELNALSTLVTLGSVAVPLMVRSIVGHRSGLTLNSDIRLVIFLLTQLSIAYLVHTLSAKIPYHMQPVKIWLLAAMMILLAILATLLSIHLYYPRTSRLYRGGIVAFFVVFNTIIVRRSGDSGSIRNFPWSLLW